jgi:hypothetical protein
MKGLSKHAAHAVQFKTKAEALAFLSEHLDSKTQQLFEVNAINKQRGKHHDSNPSAEGRSGSNKVCSHKGAEQRHPK